MQVIDPGDSTAGEKTSPPTSEARSPSKGYDVLSSPKTLPRLPVPLTQAGQFRLLSVFVRGLSKTEPDCRPAESPVFPRRAEGAEADDVPDIQYASDKSTLKLMG